MKVEKIEINKLEDFQFISSLGLKYTLEYFNDKIVAEKSFQGIKINDLLEGRYFSDDKELRILKLNGSYKATLFIEEATDKITKVEHLVIDNKFGDIKKVGIKKYIQYDSDGQAFVKCLRPYKFI